MIISIKCKCISIGFLSKYDVTNLGLAILARFFVIIALADSYFQIWLLIRWQHNCQAIRNHGANAPLYVTSSYSTWIFCREVSGFATDCPCDVLVSWINHLPPACWSTFWKSIFKHQLGYRFDILDSISSFFVFWHMQLYMSWYI